MGYSIGQHRFALASYVPKMCLGAGHRPDWEQWASGEKIKEWMIVKLRVGKFLQNLIRV